MSGGEMPNIEDAVVFAIAQSGKPYKAYGDRFGLDYYDCSGLVIRSLYEAHIPLGPGISVANKTGNTVSLYNWAKGVGGLVSVSKGISTRGAIMIKGKWYGNGPLGHTSYSLGDGREMAAHGRRTGIGISTLDAGFYQDAFIIPGVDYGPKPPPFTPEQTMIVQLNHFDAATGKVTVPTNPGAGNDSTISISNDGLFLECRNDATIANDQPVDGHPKTGPGSLRRWNAPGKPLPPGVLFKSLAGRTPDAEDPHPGGITLLTNGDARRFHLS